MNVGFLNFYMSALRNMFLLSSIAIGLVGFSDRFGNSRQLLVKIFAIGVLVMSICVGLTSTDIYKGLHVKMLKQNNLTEVDKVILQQSSIFPLFAYAYSGILSILILTLIIRIINN